MPAPNDSQPTLQDLIVIRPGGAREILTLGPTIRALMAPTIRITLVCEPSAEDATLLLPGVDAVIPSLPNDGTAGDLTDLMRAIHAPTATAMIFDAQDRATGDVARALRTNGVMRIGAVTDATDVDADTVVRPLDNEHEVVRTLGLVDTMGFSPEPGDFAIRIRRLPAPQLKPSRPYVVIESDVLDPQTLTRSVDACGGMDTPVVLVGSARPTIIPRPSIIDLRDQLNIVGLAEVCSGALAAVTGPTALAQLAAAYGVPTVGIYDSMGIVTRWHPWLVPNVAILPDTTVCMACSIRPCTFAATQDASLVEQIVHGLRHTAHIRDLEDAAAGSSTQRSKPT